MEVIVQKTPADMARAAAREVAQVLNAKPNAVLGMATGSTPLGVYQELVRMHRERRAGLLARRHVQPRRVRRPAVTHPQSYHHFMQENFFRPHQHPRAEHPHPHGTTTQLPRVLRAGTKKRIARVRRHRPADPGHRLRRPHRLQRAGRIARSAARGSRRCAETDDRRQRPLLRARDDVPMLGDHDGRRHDPRVAADPAAGQRREQGRRDRRGGGGAGDEHDHRQRAADAPVDAGSTSTSRRRRS